MAVCQQFPDGLQMGARFVLQSSDFGVILPGFFKYSKVDLCMINHMHNGNITFRNFRGLL